MTFGFSTPVDLLSWAIVLLLGTKIAATLVLLRQGREARFATRSSRLLWWSTKVTPLAALPCLIAIALLQRRVGDAWAYGLLMLLVVVAIPAMIWRRFRRPGQPAPNDHDPARGRLARASSVYYRDNTQEEVADAFPDPACGDSADRLLIPRRRQ